MNGGKMSERNAQRIADRLEYERPKITEAQVEEYRRVHYPEHVAEDYVPGQRGRPPAIPGDAYVAALSHERFHKWFGTECDDTCPHPRPVRRAPWWRRLFGAGS